MMGEFRSSLRFFRNLFKIETASDFNDMLETSQDCEHVTCVTPSIRMMILFVIVIPRMCIALILCLLGCIWLASTEKLSDVVVDAVALAFIVQIDDCLFGALLRDIADKALADFKVNITQSPSQRHFAQEFWLAATIAVVFFVAALSLPLFYMSVGQELPWINIFPGYQRQEVLQVCLPYLREHHARACILGDLCFHYGR